LRQRAAFLSAFIVVNHFLQRIVGVVKDITRCTPAFGIRIVLSDHIQKLKKSGNPCQEISGIRDILAMIAPDSS
jgi:hypothetical protein